MSTQTLLTIAQQQEWISQNYPNTILKHLWSCRGMGNSKIINNNAEVIGKAGGCGYDRYGAALGKAISVLFGPEIHKLAKRECKGRRRDYKKSEKFYGLFYDSIKDRAWVDGGCGSSCMEKILNKIGFSLEYAGEYCNKYMGATHYKLVPVKKHARSRLSW